MSYEPEAGPGRHRKPRPPIPPWEPPDWSCRCGEHPDVDAGGPAIPPCVPSPPPLPPLVIPPPGPPARHRSPRVDDPVPAGVVSLHEARVRRKVRDDLARYGKGG
ncbi:hypothetical protein [Kitasatospora sp. NPDC098663]|uniref:hypothetical protein n=1 Tax=Kitasatospora sp. NPDC098663 TaxID=3364096 RepID=UPI00382AE593